MRDDPLAPCAALTPSPWLNQHGAETLCVHEPKLPPSWDDRRSRSEPSWRNAEMSDGKSRQVVANCKKELPDLKSPFSTPWDLGRKQNKKMEQLRSPAGKQSSRTQLRTDQLGPLMEQSSRLLSLLTTFPTAPGHLPPFPMPKSQSTKH